VADPEAMLREAYRVLQPGGIAVFSVWGRRDALNMFDLLHEALSAVGKPPKAGRSNFHLNDPKLLCSKIKSAGFTRTMYYFYSVPMYHLTPEEALEQRFLKFPQVKEVMESGDTVTAGKLR
jgi:ubiquinone/menaquinone biosynthesis C-methylase UbiE